MDKEIKDDPRSRRTRRLLQAAFNDLLAQKKFHEITVQDIATRADVNRATFYAHFVDKYDLLNADIRDSFQAVVNKNMPEHSAFTLENLRILMRTAHEYLAEMSGHCAAPAGRPDEMLIVQQVQRQLHSLILDWLRESPVKSVPNSIEVTAMVVSWSIFGAIIQGTGHNCKLPSEQLVAQVLAVLEPGLRVYLEARAAG